MSTATHHPLKKIFSISSLTIFAFILGSLGLSPSVGLAQSRSITATSAQLETLYLNNNRSYSYNLIAAKRGVIDRIVIPKGATIVGKYIPAKGGLRYVAEAVTYDRYSYRISASSSVLEDVKDRRDTSVGAIAEDAAIGAAGGTIVGEIFGDNSLIAGKILAVHVAESALRLDDLDDRDLLLQNPLLAYLSPGRYAKIAESYSFPFHQGFHR